MAEHEVPQRIAEGKFKKGGVNDPPTTPPPPPPSGRGGGSRNQMIDDIDSVLKGMARKGITVSIVHGDTDKHGICYSVDVETEDGDSFQKPYAATSINQAVAVALAECTMRGWFKIGGWPWAN